VKRRCIDVLGAAALMPILAGCTTTNTASTGDVPEPLKAPPSQVLSVRVHASGAQIYDCKPSKSDPLRFEWTFRAPEADLFDRSGRKIGKHYAGPTWEANDGSKVVGEVLARDNGPDPAAIPWLLLRATSATGPGKFGATQSIQRLHTVGGKAPTEGCSQARGDQEVRVPYTAEYLFYTAKR
jgi:hypothetical protein